ncbi:MAG: type IV pili twitching motility protein PilT [Candidatus Omnitrophica bacterium CG11_big_fil_rev_8_21_14_0_20_64_10]|nr:MAG: type IV pili twitching motility protein PilT [Candidatus Omnitrophica bacterium CG11_big_fil_rev_8_21_14_0_20_64_10]
MPGANPGKPAPADPQADDQANRRQAYRARLACPMVYQVLQEGRAAGPLIHAHTINISSKGILMRTTQAQELNATIEAQINLPGVQPALSATGRIVRVEEEEEGKWYLIGVSFSRLEPESHVTFLNQLEVLAITELLKELMRAGGSDLHLTTGQPPIIRLKGKLTPLNRPAFQSHQIRASLYSIMSEEKIQTFEKTKELDFAYSLAPEKRFRFNVHWQRGQVEAAIRVIPAKIPTWEQLHVPPVVLDWCDKANGLILVVGPTGSGKTTTINTLIHEINKKRDAIIICLERPIEYVHTNIKSVIKQREIGSDTLSFAEAVKRSLRQDPDVIVVGEVEDAETAQVVLAAAETGNLVFASFHATNTIQAVDRFLNICPAQMRTQVSFQLASVLQGVLTQHLLPKEEAMGGGIVLATEVFVPSEGGKSHIRNGTLSQLYSAIETGGSYGMHTLESSIKKLVQQGIVSEETAQAHLALATQRV